MCVPAELFVTCLTRTELIMSWKALLLLLSLLLLLLLLLLLSSLLLFCVLVQAHLEVSGHLVDCNALHPVEELPLVHGACLPHHLLLAAVH